MKDLDDEDVYNMVIQAARFSKVSILRAMARDFEKMIESKTEKVHVLRKRNQENKKKRRKRTVNAEKERPITLDEDGNEEVLYSDDSGVTYFQGESADEEESGEDN